MFVVMGTAQKMLLEIIWNPEYNIQVLIENILGVDRLIDEMVENVKSRNEDLCEEVLKDILAEPSNNFIPNG